jgi:phosphohistidine phosphatase
VPLTVLMRHAKSAYPAGVVDHERPLSARGRANAEVAAAWFRTQRSMGHLMIDTALVSTAVRAQQTWEIIASGVQSQEVLHLPTLYHASPRVIADHIAAYPQSNVLVVGHNPGLHEFARTFLTDSAHGDGMLDRFPTSAIAVMDDAHLLDVVIPR